jgi:predicted DNA-binding protein (MmcQ/YjbR family)
MDLAGLRARCLTKRGASAEHPFGPGALVVKVGGRIFAIIGEDAEPLTISLKCEPELGALLRDAYEAVRPGYHLNKRHWITVTLDGTVPEPDLLGWIDDSYDLVVAGLPRRARDAL